MLATSPRPFIPTPVVASGEPQEKLRALFQSANAGNAEAQNSVGKLFFGGLHGVPQDDRLAFHYFQSAATQGLAGAIYNLGIMYEDGRGTAPDHQRALELFQLAADQGFSEAQCKVAAHSFPKEHHPDQDYQQSLHYFGLAAEQDHPKAQCALGLMYRNGFGVKRNVELALYYLTLAADQGRHDAQYTLAQMYFDGDQGIPQNSELAKHYAKLSAGQGNEKARALLQLMVDT